jgi:hypothetical protein
MLLTVFWALYDDIYDCVSLLLSIFPSFFAGKLLLVHNEEIRDL